MPALDIYHNTVKMELTKSDSQNSPDKSDLLSELVQKVVADFESNGASTGVEILKDNKISTALFQFIEPYHDDETSRTNILLLLDLALIAWNISFLPKREQRKEIDAMFQDPRFFAHDMTPEFKSNFRGMLTSLIARKKQYFSKYKRLIIDFELTETPEKFDLSVVSAPIP